MTNTMKMNEFKEYVKKKNGNFSLSPYAMMELYNEYQTNGFKSVFYVAGDTVILDWHESEIPLDGYKSIELENNNYLVNSAF